MPHFYTVRSGWEGERLAEYLLSRFSFVAQPITTADDVGSDFGIQAERLVWHVVKNYAKKIGIAQLAPHDLRRYAESRTMPNALRGGAPAGRRP
jgi:hypothetical protein